MCNGFATIGYMTSWGIYQAYYQEAILKDYALVFLPGLIIGRLFDLGHCHVVLLSSGALLVTATFLIGQCKVYWQFLLCQGIGIGLGCGGNFGPTCAIVGHWFKKRCGLALGYMAAGASLGGIALPIMTKNLIPKVGFEWTMRIIGFILLVVLGISNLVCGLCNFSMFKTAAYSIYCLSSFLIYLGLYTLLTYVNVSASQLGTSPRLAFYYVTFANVGSLFGRWGAGLLVDHVGSLNVSIPLMTFVAVLTYIWPFTRSISSLIAITIIYGICSGAYISLMMNPIMNLGGEGDIGRRIGMFTTIMACVGGFEVVELYGGSMIIAGVARMVVVRCLMSRRWIARI
ncbi:MFS general substrate transporter [Macrolepiota fuliginosa MF-IS2]|uniref:MFS general substrate transporter n=1 Tax=Macrolepiota fuliginosa MF-IS2 TaxID=1400762 RepID=A0A9P6BYG2_9AGAR|nr:MFS general substrate transporter [Macrolepiota fuliginosa MF-IS2]